MAARHLAAIRVRAARLAVEPLGMRAGSEIALARGLRLWRCDHRIYGHPDRRRSRTAGPGRLRHWLALQDSPPGRLSRRRGPLKERSNFQSRTHSRVSADTAARTIKAASRNHGSRNPTNPRGRPSSRAYGQLRSSVPHRTNRSVPRRQLHADAFSVASEGMPGARRPWDNAQTEIPEQIRLYPRNTLGKRHEIR